MVKLYINSIISLVECWVCSEPTSIQKAESRPGTAFQLKKIQESQANHRRNTGDFSPNCLKLQELQVFIKIQANFYGSQNTEDNCHFTGITGGRARPVKAEKLLVFSEGLAYSGSV